MSYDNWPIDDNHQLACAMRSDGGLIVRILNVVYRIHNRILTTAIRWKR